MITVFCVCVAPKYTFDDVITLYQSVSNHLKLDFEFVCLADQEYFHDGITTYDVKSYDLDTWWNKVLVFDKKFSKNINLYFDLDVIINEDISSLVDQLDDQHITVVNTPWKNDRYFAQRYLGTRAYKIADALFHYGNTSVMGWKNDKQYLVDALFNDFFHHTSKNFGDDTFINKNGKVNYFKFDIKRHEDSKAAINI